MEFTLTFLKLFAISIYLIGPLLIFLGGLIVALGQIVTHIEKWTKFDGLYWSFVTATTLGYGDIRPLQKMSKALSILIAIVGVMFTGLIISTTLYTAESALKKHIDPSVIERIQDGLAS